jgi:hypothetical protein
MRSAPGVPGRTSFIHLAGSVSQELSSGCWYMRGANLAPWREHDGGGGQWKRVALPVSHWAAYDLCNVQRSGCTWHIIPCVDALRDQPWE